MNKHIQTMRESMKCLRNAIEPLRNQDEAVKLQNFRYNEKVDESIVMAKTCKNEDDVERKLE